MDLAAKLAEAFGYPTVPVLHQDNISAIHMMEKGGGTSKHTKHFDMRLRFLQEKISNYEFTTQYTPTKEMLADGFTKALTGKSHHEAMDELFAVKKAKQMVMFIDRYFDCIEVLTKKGSYDDAMLYKALRKQTSRGCAESPYVRTVYAEN